MDLTSSLLRNRVPLDHIDLAFVKFLLRYLHFSVYSIVQRVGGSPRDPCCAVVLQVTAGCSVLAPLAADISRQSAAQGRGRGLSPFCSHLSASSV